MRHNAKAMFSANNKTNLKREKIMKKLTAYEAWKKKKKENLTDEEFKSLLFENGIIQKKVKRESKKAL